ncbi:hypothetical protein R3P38DRAFT_3620600 [Favolaschia claudopus]|uniref:Uncharacterized protein n=1 Tax=Favolaschia claudopus TaxID=2862362 RepID=A0AAW0DFF7_9AGAR
MLDSGWVVLSGSSSTRPFILPLNQLHFNLVLVANHVAYYCVVYIQSSSCCQEVLRFLGIRFAFNRRGAVRCTFRPFDVRTSASQWIWLVDTESMPRRTKPPVYLKLNAESMAFLLEIFASILNLRRLKGSEGRLRYRIDFVSSRFDSPTRPAAHPRRSILVPPRTRARPPAIPRIPAFPSVLPSRQRLNLWRQISAHFRVDRRTARRNDNVGVEGDEESIARTRIFESVETRRRRRDDDGVLMVSTKAGGGGAVGWGATRVLEMEGRGVGFGSRLSEKRGDGAAAAFWGSGSSGAADIHMSAPASRTAGVGQGGVESVAVDRGGESERDGGVSETANVTHLEVWLSGKCGEWSNWVHETKVVRGYAAFMSRAIRVVVAGESWGMGVEVRRRPAGDLKKRVVVNVAKSELANPNPIADGTPLLQLELQPPPTQANLWLLQLYFN